MKLEKMEFTLHELVVSKTGRHLVMTVMTLENHRGQPSKPQRHAIICLSNLICPALKICFHLSLRPRACDNLSSHIPVCISDLILTNRHITNSKSTN